MVSAFSSITELSYVAHVDCEDHTYSHRVPLSVISLMFVLFLTYVALTVTSAFVNILYIDNINR